MCCPSSWESSKLRPGAGLGWEWVPQWIVEGSRGLSEVFGGPVVSLVAPAGLIKTAVCDEALGSAFSVVALAGGLPWAPGLSLKPGVQGSL